MKINPSRIFLVALFIFITIPSGASATSTWTQVSTDSFSRSNGAVGNSWDDESSTGAISTSTLLITMPASSNTGGPRILRPSAEASLDQRVDATFILSASDVSNSAIERRLILRAHKDQTSDGSNLYSSYQAKLTNGGVFQIVRMYNGLELTPNANSGSNGVFTATAGHTYLASFSVTNMFPSNVLLTLIDMTASTTQVIASTSISDYAYGRNASVSDGLNKTNTFMQSGVVGVGMLGTSGQTVTYTNVTTYNSSQSGSMVVPTIIGNGQGDYYNENRKYYLTTQNPTGGTASSTSITNPYYIRWYRGSGNFTPPLTRDGSGGGSGTFVGTGNEVTDSTAPTGVSNYSISYKAIFFDYGAASTTGVLNGFTNINSPSALKVVNIQYIGDSITYGLLTSTNSNSTSPGAFAQTILNADSSITSVYSPKFLFQGVSGKTSNDFAGNLLGYVRSAAYDSQIGISSIMLGTNDAKDSATTSTAQYKSNIQTIMSAVSNAATTTSPKFVLNKTTWVAPGALGLWSTSSQSVLQGYFGQLDQLANGTNTVVGSTSAYSEVEKYGYAAGHTHIGSASYPSPGPVLGTSDYLFDGVHPYDGGAKMIATLEWAPNIKNALLSNYTPAYTPPDTTPPNATTTAPTSGQTVSGSSVTLSATSTDNIGVVGVKFYVDNTLIGVEATTSPYSVAWNSTSVIDGAHSIVSVARDAAGNIATSTSISFSVDNTAPVRSAGSPSGTLSLNTTSTTISLTTGENATCKYSTSSSQVYASMTAFGTTGSTAHSQSVSGLTNGTSYTYYVKCSDSYSNINATDYNISFNVAADVTAPTVSITNPTSNAVLTGSTISLSANATDDAAVAGVKFYIGNASNVKTLIGTEDTSNPYAVTWDSTSVSDGAGYFAFAVARDAAGNIATSTSIAFSVDNTAPVRSAGAPSGTLGINTSTTTISLTTNENATCKYSTSSGQSFASMTAFGTTGSTAHSQSVSGLTNGTSYIYYVKCSDVYSNINATDYAISFNVASDITSPTVTLISPVSNSLLRGTVSLSANATDDVAVAGVKFYLNNTLIGTEDTSYPYSGSLNTTSFLDGTSSIFAVARDTTGNISTSSATVITIDNTAPVISSISSNTPSAAGASITWNTNEVSDSNVYYGTTTSYGSSAQSTTTVQSHSINISGLTELTSYHFIVVSTDLIGNQATSSDQTFSTISSDVTPPVISNASPSSQQPSGTTGVMLSVSTDENAVCKYNTNTGVTYASVSNVTFTTTGTTTHSVMVTGLSDGNTYTYFVKCADSHLNVVNDYPITFSVASAPTNTVALGSQTGGGSVSNGNWQSVPVSNSNLNTTNQPGANASLPIQFTASSRTGTISLEVKELQYFLNTHGFPIAKNGSGSLGKESTYFGTLTKLAVQKFQKANSITPANGLFGPKTKAVVNALLIKNKK